jgi:alginate O-acetyltransferase complex protein AlgI
LAIGFLASGIVHDLVISLPARGGWGGPTIYFVVQGLGLLVERSRIGRSLGLARGWRGWLYAMLVLVAPAYWLFHPPFIRTVVLPFLTAIGATSSDL